jgi:FlaG/FlaF family flagellin (archaellin)
LLNRTEKRITSNEQAVSEVLGQVLLVGIVVIMLSVLGVFFFSQDGPADVPHTDVQEIMDTSTDMIYLKHNGGEPISSRDAEIIVNINGKKYVYTSSQIYESLGNSNVWKVGDTIEINTMNTWTVDLKNNDQVELFLVDTPSNELIQKSRLTSVFKTETDFEMMVVPGNIIDTSKSKDEAKNGYGTKKQVSGTDSTKKDDAPDNDNIANEAKNCTTYYPPRDVINPDIYQEFDFSIKPAAYGMRPGDTLVNVTLTIVYYTHDNSYAALKLKFYDIDEYGQGKWVYYKNDLPVHNTEFKPETINLTEYINTPADLAHFKVRIEAARGAETDKDINIDYMGLWVEKANYLASPESVS